MGGRGGGGRKTTAPSGPPRPTPLQTALEFAKSFQPPRPVEPAIPPAQVLQRLLEPIQMRLDTLMQRQPSMNLPINITQPPINITQPSIKIRQPDINMPPINITQPSIKIRQPDINMPPINIRQPDINMPPINIRQPDILVSPPNVSINQRFPDINMPPVNVSVNQQFPFQRERERERVEENRRFSTSEREELHRDHNRQHVADLPDAPLVQPNAPLVLAGPMRMDDPHEDVPLNQVDPAFVLGKYEAQKEEVPIEVAMKEMEREQEREKIEMQDIRLPSQASDRYRSIPLTFEALNKLYFKYVEGKTPSNAITLQDLARKGYGLTLSRELLSKGKPGLIDYLLNTVGQ